MSTPLKIAMMLDNEFTGDMRVENEVISLQKAGHQVFVLCLNHGTKKAKENYHGATIIRLPLSKWRTKKMRGLVNTFFDPYSEFWKKQLLHLIKTENIDAVHVHDLYLIGGALKARKKLGKNIPIVADLHENYPHALKNYQFVKRFPGKYIISIKKWEKTELQWLQEVDHIITVIEEAVDRYVELGIDGNKISVVPNYVNPDEFLIEGQIPEIDELSLNPPSALYIGAFDLHRGLESVVHAMPEIVKAIPDFKLVLVGAGANEEDLKLLVKKLGVSRSIEFMGWRKPAELPEFIKNATLCLIPHLKSVHTDNTIPHKLFQYMIMGKPVVVSNCAPLERIVKKTETGVVFESNNSSDLAKRIIPLATDYTTLKEMGEKGQIAVGSEFNWGMGEKKLLQLYCNKIVDSIMI